ncbi:hypothetical protein C8256_04240 [Kluyvera genomosp. 2]|uniref:Uncharacterized protein n=1 Tax=Kluyvera genomosp. 2 TaxID=2774054 RepID=A0A2T2Y745_9ENTR|nr:hypothetical protein C8256_04240 [Kluyvera genomosp. 2]
MGGEVVATPLLQMHREEPEEPLRVDKQTLAADSDLMVNKETIIHSEMAALPIGAVEEELVLVVASKLRHTDLVAVALMILRFQDQKKQGVLECQGSAS